MRTILIADDEKIERRGIRSLLGREQIQAEILEASNGKEALELVKQHKPDIVFSDIKMPFMTGLELAEQVGAVSPDTIMIMFSGYSDFEYAREAIKSGVMDYVLKPIDPAEFKASLHRALERIEEREQSDEQSRKNQDFLEEYFLQKFLTGRQEALEEAAELLDVSWWHTVRRVVLLETATDFFEGVKEDFPELLHAELQVPFRYLNLEPSRSLLFFDADVKVDFRVMAQHIHDFLHSRLHADCFVAVCGELESGLQLPEGFREAESLMEHRFYRQDLRVFLPDMNLSGKDNYEVVVHLLEKMEEDIRLRDITHLWEHFRMFSQQKHSGGQISHIFIRFSCSNIVKELYRGMNLPQERCSDVIEQLYRCGSIAEILAILEICIRTYEETMFANRSSARSDVEKVKSYIYEHYADELSVEILGEKVFLSPGYVSYIFKKETGEGLSHFIRVYRLEQAKQLLQTSNRKIVQICKACGFTNASYFCKSFREYYGCSPERFRKGAGVNEESDPVAR